MALGYCDLSDGFHLGQVVGKVEDHLNRLHWPVVLID